MIETFFVYLVIAVFVAYLLTPRKEGGRTLPSPRLSTKPPPEPPKPMPISHREELADGLDALGEFEPLPKGQELVNFWGARIGKCGRAILEALVEVYSNAITRVEIAALTGYEAGSGSFSNYISKLRTLELINGTKEIKAADCLFA